MNNLVVTWPNGSRNGMVATLKLKVLLSTFRAFSPWDPKVKCICNVFLGDHHGWFKWNTFENENFWAKAGICPIICEHILTIISTILNFISELDNAELLALVYEVNFTRQKFYPSILAARNFNNTLHSNSNTTIGMVTGEQLDNA